MTCKRILIILDILICKIMHTCEKKILLHRTARIERIKKALPYLAFSLGFEILLVLIRIHEAICGTQFMS